MQGQIPYLHFHTSLLFLIGAFLVKCVADVVEEGLIARQLMKR